MEKIMNLTKKIIGFVMTLIIIVGVIFVFLYAIGIVPYAVVSGSMSPNIPTGSLCFINKHIKYEDIKEGDVIAYVAVTGANVTHRVISITDEGIETKGDRNESSDGISTTKDNYLGKNVFSIPKLGYSVRIIQSARGRFVIGTFIVVILVACFLTDDEKEKNNKKKVINANV